MPNVESMYSATNAIKETLTPIRKESLNSIVLPFYREEIIETLISIYDINTLAFQYTYLLYKLLICLFDALRLMLVRIS